MVKKFKDNRRKLLYAATAFLGALIFSSAWGFLEVGLYRTFRAVGAWHCQPDAPVVDSGSGLGGMGGFRSIERLNTRMIEKLLGKDLAKCNPGPHWSFKAFLKVNLQYFGELAYAFLLILTPAFLVCALSFLIACLLEELDRRWSRLGIADFIVEAIDSLPYILWSIPFIYGAVQLREMWRPRSSYPGWLHFSILFFGFSLFLMLFFIRQNRRKLRDLGASGMVDGLRVTGIGTVRLYSRIFRFQFFRRLFSRQFLYAMVFIMLFDFSFCSIHEAYQSTQKKTVFARGGHLLDRATVLKADLKLSTNNESYATSLERLSGLLPGNHPGQELIRGLIRREELIFQPDRRKALADVLKKELANAWERDEKERFKKLNTLKSKLSFFSSLEQETAFTSSLAYFYTGMNGAFIFLLFFIIFIKFDIRGLLDEK